MKFPAAAYDVNWHETSDVHTKIVASGYWRCCRVCREIREMKSGGSSSSHKAYTCARCKQHREIFCFPDDSNVCKACHLHEHFQYIMCSSCCKPNLEKTMHCPDGSGKMQLCEACAGQEVLYTCTVCQSAKTVDSFRANKRDLMRKFHRRCKECERCRDCEKHYLDFRMFAVDSQRCVKCTEAGRLHVCQVCNMHKQHRITYLAVFTA